eukprot:scaffold88690_cov26-Tisochrysis_lutea.AAC.1
MALLRLDERAEIGEAELGEPEKSKVAKYLSAVKWSREQVRAEGVHGSRRGLNARCGPPGCSASYLGSPCRACGRSAATLHRA